MMATLLQSVSRLAILCINHDIAHKLACHEPYTLLLHVLTLRSLIDWLRHWRYFKHHWLSLNELLRGFIVDLHPWVFRMLVIDKFYLFTMTLTLLHDFLWRIVQTSLCSCVWIRNVFAVDMIEHAICLIHCEINLNIIENIVHCRLITVAWLLTISAITVVL